MDSIYTKAHIRESLDPRPSAPDEDMQWLAGASPDVVSQVRAALPARRVPAAVLVPLVARATGLTVLLTQRAATLKDHAGQISFPGGRIEPRDQDAWHAALRETREEIGLLPDFVEFAGYLPDHLVVTGFRVTPVVGFVDPQYQLRIAKAEVHDAFEVPLDFILDAANHKSRRRSVGGLTIEVHDIPYGDRNIWGATAGMLMTLRRKLQTRRRDLVVSGRLSELLSIMARLRAAGGCPWDREQTFASIAPYTIEEAYEVADAAERGDMRHLKDELGDLLFQVVFHAQMASESGEFDFEAVAGTICDKLRAPPSACVRRRRAADARRTKRDLGGHQGARARRRGAGPRRRLPVQSFGRRAAGAARPAARVQTQQTGGARGL